MEYWIALVVIGLLLVGEAIARHHYLTIATLIILGFGAAEPSPASLVDPGAQDPAPVWAPPLTAEQPRRVEYAYSLALARRPEGLPQLSPAVAEILGKGR